MKLSALPAVSLSICSAIHPSSDLSTSGGGGGGCPPPEAFRSALTGHQPASRKSARRRRGARLLSACCTRSSTETLSYSRQPLLLDALGSPATPASAGKHGFLSPGANPPRCCCPPPRLHKVSVAGVRQKQQIVAKTKTRM